MSDEIEKRLKSIEESLSIPNWIISTPDISFLFNLCKELRAEINAHRAIMGDYATENEQKVAVVAALADWIDIFLMELPLPKCHKISNMIRRNFLNSKVSFIDAVWRTRRRTARECLQIVLNTKVMHGDQYGGYLASSVDAESIANVISDEFGLNK